MKFINRSLIISMLFLMTGIGVTFAAGSNSTQNFLLGNNTGLTQGDVNQVLTLLVGPQGKPGARGLTGATGPAGAPGAAGPQGPAGADGRQGIDGAAGKDGVSVVTALLPVGDANCPTGGVTLTAGTNVTYVCNGRQGLTGATGATGATGPQGPAGANGTGGGGGGGGTSTGYGAGTLTGAACDNDVNVQLKHSFSGGKFSLTQIVMNNLKAVCANQTLTVYFNIATSGVLRGDGAALNKYAARTPADEIVCTKVLSGTNWTGTGDNRQITIEGSDACTVTRGNTPILLSEISSLDIQENVGFELG